MALTSLLGVDNGDNNRPNESKEIIKYLTKSAEGGNAYAMYELAEWYHHGHYGTSTNKEKAIDLYTKAAKMGHEWAKDEIERLKRFKSGNGNGLVW